MNCVELPLLMSKSANDSEKEFLCLNFAELARTANWTENKFFLQHALLLPWIPPEANTACLIGVVPGLLPEEGILRAQCAYLQRNSGHVSFIVIFIAYYLDMLLTCRAMMWCRYRQFSVVGGRFAAEAETYARGEGREGSFQTEALGPELRVPGDAL